ncbi:YnfA family protein [Rubrobacter indicoceani]|uniref:YnfA family protein n=1 Tax=Rubrobacter indicoceani TaxID=2051957 RepID=UPI001F0A0333|nr:YnfA family protein [Rubrobacter indicoceani]
MNRTAVILLLFVVAGLCEIGGGYLIWTYLRADKPIFFAFTGAIILALYGVLAALQPIPEFGRVYAAYGGIFIVLAIVWSVVVDGFRPDRYDLAGALVALAGAAIIALPERP